MSIRISNQNGSFICSKCIISSVIYTQVEFKYENQVFLVKIWRTRTRKPNGNVPVTLCSVSKVPQQVAYDCPLLEPGTMKQNDKAINAAGKSRPTAGVMPGAGTAVLRTVTTASLLGLSHLHSRDPGRPSKSAKPTLLRGHGPLTGGQMPSSEAAGELTAARDHLPPAREPAHGNVC